MGPENVTYWIIYRYDEAGNRIFKLQYKYIVSTPPEGYEDSLPGDSLVVEQGDGNGYWVFQSKSFYVRDITGKEIAVYSGTSIEQWNIYGLDNVGKIDANNKRYYYLKDHLGSIRATLDTTNAVVSAQDYDCWGYPLENRSWQSGQSVNQRYKFTGKEHDNENNYDYFGARYYDSRIANWTSIDPLFEKHFDYTPYNYVLRSPLIFIDPEGLQVRIAGTEEQRDGILNLIQNGLPEFISDYVALEEMDGTFIINKTLLEQVEGSTDSPEYNALLNLVRSEQVTEISLIDPFTEFSYTEYTTFHTGNTTTTLFNDRAWAESILSGKANNSHGFYYEEIIDKTLPPAVSNKGINEVLISDRLALKQNGKVGVPTLAHELYGHINPYIKGDEMRHGFGTVDTDAEDIETRALQNYEERVK